MGSARIEIWVGIGAGIAAVLGLLLTQWKECNPTLKCENDEAAAMQELALESRRKLSFELSDFNQGSNLRWVRERGTEDHNPRTAKISQLVAEPERNRRMRLTVRASTDGHEQQLWLGVEKGTLQAIATLNDEVKTFEPPIALGLSHKARVLLLPESTPLEAVQGVDVCWDDPLRLRELVLEGGKLFIKKGTSR